MTIPARCILCRSHSKKRTTCGSTSPGADKVSTGHLPEKRQGAWPHGAVCAAGHRRRGDRIAMHYAAVHESASLIGRLGSSAFRPSTVAAAMSLAGSCFSPESAHKPLYGAFWVKQGDAFCPSSVSWLDLARPHADSFEHDDAVGMTIRGEPAFGRG